MTIEKAAPAPKSLPCRPPERPLAPLSGLLLRALEGRPFARSLFKWYGGLGLVAYCAVVGLANSQQWSWLKWWMDLWQPAVRLLRDFIPLFDNYAAVFVEKGLAHRIDLIHHVLAVCWIANSIMFVYLFWTVFRLTQDEWCRLVSVAWRPHLALVFIGGVFFFFGAFYWTFYGFGLDDEDILYAFHRYDAILFGIGVMFYGVTLFGIGALIVGSRHE